VEHMEPTLPQRGKGETDPKMQTWRRQGGSSKGATTGSQCQFRKRVSIGGQERKMWPNEKRIKAHWPNRFCEEADLKKKAYLVWSEGGATVTKEEESTVVRWR